MSWPTIDLTKREEDIRTRLAARLGATVVPGSNSVMGAITAAFAESLDDEHQYANWLVRQLFVSTAVEDWLVGYHGPRLGLTRHNAGAASGPVVLTGSNGVVIDKGTVLQTESGLLLRTQEAGTIDGGNVTVTAQMQETGTGGNIEAATGLSLVQPIAGISGNAVTGAVFECGRNQEHIESFRARLAFRENFPPGAGHETDYIAWAGDVPGVSHVWPSAMEMGLGTMTVRFAAWDEPGGPIPTADLRNQVVEQLEGHISPITGTWQGRPAGTQVFVVVPEALPVDLQLSGLTPDNASVWDAIRASVTAMLRRKSAPGKTIHIDWVREAISQATGENQHVLEAPTADLVPGVNQMVTMGSITTPLSGGTV